MPMDGNWTPMIRAGRLLNKGLSHIMETWHGGKLAAEPFTGLVIDQSNVMLSAVKRSEDGTGTVLRVYETVGAETVFTASGPVLPHPLTAKITPWSVQTWFCKDGQTAWEEVLLTEYPM